MGFYTVTFDNVSVAAAQDLFEVVAGTGRPLRIHALFYGQSSDAGDAQAENLRVRLVRGYTTSGFSGTTPSLAPLRPGSAAAGFTAEVNNLSVATGGPALIVHADTWNVAAGFTYVPTPECRPEVASGERFVVNLPAAPADPLTMSGTLYVEEL
jgi:hypothetical protein